MRKFMAILVLIVFVCLQNVSDGLAATKKDVVLSQWWELTGSMHDKRIDFTLSVLPDGKALAAGGTHTDGGTFYLKSSETYDSLSGTWTLMGNMNASRTRHTATVLLNGQVLVAGGVNGQGSISSAEIYNPLNQTWGLTGVMSQAREGHTATRLSDGRVLVVGGCQTIACLVSAEIYNPATGTWQVAANLPAGARKYHTAVLLFDGSVLVAGGYNSAGTSPTYYKDAYRYNPGSNTWSAAGSMSEYRSQHTAVLQRNGKVMVVGGYGVPPFGSATWPNTTELYDPATNSWMKLKNGSGVDIIIDFGKKQTMGILDALGSYYLFGGTDGTASNTVMVRSLLSETDEWHPHGNLQEARYGAAAVQLPNGSILLAGGKNHNLSNSNGMTSAEINRIQTGSTELTYGSGILGTVYSSGTLLPNGDILFTGGAEAVHQSNSLPCHKTAYLWVNEEAIDSLAAQMNWQRCDHSTTLLSDGRVVVLGGKVATLVGSAAGTGEILSNGVWTSFSGPTFLSPETAILPDGEIFIIDSATRPHGYLFNPDTLTFRETIGDYTGAYNGNTLTLMNNGKVLILGSSTSDITEVYDPETETFSSVPSLSDRRLTHTATLLPNGKVLIAGGRYGSGPNQGAPIAATYLFNPAALPANPWTVLDEMHNARYFHSAVLLPDGMVAVLGGQLSSTDAINSIEIYNPAFNTWAVTGSMLVDRSAHKTLLSTNGKLVTFGGYGDGYTARNTVEQFELSNISISGFFWRPTVSGATCLNCAGDWKVDVTGEGFISPPEGSSGGTSQSATNTVLVQIIRLDNQQVLWLHPGEASSDTHFVSAPIVGFPSGPVLVNVFSKGSVKGTVLLRKDQSFLVFVPILRR